MTIAFEQKKDFNMTQFWKKYIERSILNYSDSLKIRNKCENNKYTHMQPKKRETSNYCFLSVTQMFYIAFEQKKDYNLIQFWKKYKIK